jgi:hypothetical protein
MKRVAERELWESENEDREGASLAPRQGGEGSRVRGEVR